MAQRQATRLPLRSPLSIGTTSSTRIASSGADSETPSVEPNGPSPGTSNMTTSAMVSSSRPATVSSRHSRWFGPSDGARRPPTSLLPSGIARSNAKKCTRSASVPT
jgi:hypothetical protein